MRVVVLGAAAEAPAGVEVRKGPEGVTSLLIFIAKAFRHYFYSFNTCFILQ